MAPDVVVVKLGGAILTKKHQRGVLDRRGLRDCVDAVVVFDEDTPLELIEAVRPHVLVKGGDYERDQVVGHDVIEAWGGTVELVPLLPGHSTSNLVERIRSETPSSRP